MAEQQLELASLVSRIEQIEQQQIVIKKYVTGLKSKLDSLTQEFTTRSELQQLASLQGEIAYLQQQFNQLSNLREYEDNSDTSETPAIYETTKEAEYNFDNVEREKLFCERVEPLGQKSVSVNAAQAEHQDEQINTVAKPEREVTAFSDEEFKIERILLLLMRDDADEESQDAVSVEEFLQRYRKGERDFTGINLENSDFYKANLRWVKLGKAKLKKVNFSEAYLVEADLSESNLSQADLFKANLEVAKLTGTNLSEADLSSAKLMKANLNNANLSKARLIGADLRSAKLRNVNLSGADLTKADLRGNTPYNDIVDLQGANLEGATLKQALCDENTRFPVGFNPQEAGVYFITLSGSLQKVDLSGADFKSSKLNGADLTGAKLIKANLEGADLSVATLNEADLREANLFCAKLRGANLTGADLRAANLSLADLSGADLSGAKLGGANLNNAKLTGAIMPDGTTHE